RCSFRPGPRRQRSGFLWNKIIANCQLPIADCRFEMAGGNPNKLAIRNRKLAINMNLYKYASPATFYPLAGKMIPWFAIPAALLFATGLFVGFFIAPP